MTPRCGFLHCGSPARWVLQDGAPLHGYTHACTAHVGALLTDSPLTTVTPLDPGIRPLRIYVAAPYSAPSEAAMLDHVHAALDVGLDLLTLGHLPFVPHLSHWLDKRALRTRDGVRSYDAWMTYALAWVAQCDALYYVAASPGADEERAEAVRLGLPIYTTFGAVPRVL